MIKIEKRQENKLEYEEILIVTSPIIKITVTKIYSKQFLTGPYFSVKVISMQEYFPDLDLYLETAEQLYNVLGIALQKIKSEEKND